MCAYRALAPMWEQVRVPDKSNAVYIARQPFAMTVEDKDHAALSVDS